VGATATVTSTGTLETLFTALAAPTEAVPVVGRMIGGLIKGLATVSGLLSQSTLNIREAKLADETAELLARLLQVLIKQQETDPTRQLVQHNILRNVQQALDELYVVSSRYLNRNWFTKRLYSKAFRNTLRNIRERVQFLELHLILSLQMEGRGRFHVLAEHVGLEL